MMKRRYLWTIVAVMVTLVIVSCTASPEATPEEEAPADEELVFGMILVGPKDDQGWSQAHYQAGLYLEEAIPDSRMILVDSLNPDARPDMSVAKAVSEMEADGADLIFITSDDFSADTGAVAEEYPEMVFIHATGDHALQDDPPANIGNYMPRMVFGKMIAGCTAALATSTGQVAYVGPLINDETRRLANATYLGARHCYDEYRSAGDPLEFSVEWIGYWFHIPGVTRDPIEVSNTLVDQGVDVLISGLDTTEVLTVASERSEAGDVVRALAYDYEGACEAAPDVCLGVPYFSWRSGYLRLAQEVQAGTWAPGWEWVPPDWDNLTDLEESPIGFTRGSALTAEQSDTLDDFIDGLADGSTVLFEGPLLFQDGTVFLGDGEVASDEELWYMPQLLEGMEGLSE